MAQISGSSSVDALSGTDGSDVFSGFAGDDSFIFTGRGSAQSDVIVDFGAIYFGGAVTGAQEVPAVSTSATGSVSAWLNRAQTELFFASTVAGLDFGGQTAATADDVTAAHFHAAAPGVSGGVVFGFMGAPNNEQQGETVVTAATSTVTGSWDLAEGNNTTLAAQVSNLLGGRVYINFHTAPNPSGEIRGQLNVLDSGADKVDLRGSGIGDFATLQSFMTEAGGSTTISLMWNGAANNLVLQGVSMSRLSAADFIFADASARSNFGTTGADFLFGAAGDDQIYADAGNDRIVAGSGNDYVDGQAGDDTIQGMDGNDNLTGGLGNDDVNGNVGNDRVSGGDGVDTVRGGQGDDTVYGDGGGDAHVNGNLGQDAVFGGEGSDTLYGGQGNDTLSGEAGDDWLSGDLGTDVLYGGAGADRFLYRAGSSGDWIGDFNFADGDRVQLATGTTYVAGSHQGQAIITLSTGESLGFAGVVSSSFSSQWIVFV